MKYQIFSFITMIIIGGACRQGAEKDETVRHKFRLPFIIQKTVNEAVEQNHADSLGEASFKLFGKFKFTDTLDLSNTALQDAVDKDDYHYEYKRPEIEDTLTTDGFQIFIDHKTTILDYRYPIISPLEAFMPVYVVNETSKTKLFFGKDKSVLGLIEAADTVPYGSWRPITHRGGDFCGNGYFGLKVRPGEFVMFLIPKFAGSWQGRMRVRLKIGESVYASSFFPGSFNPDQFYIKKNSWIHRDMKRDKHGTVSGEFYGAVPKEYE